MSYTRIRAQIVSHRDVKASVMSYTRIRAQIVSHRDVKASVMSYTRIRAPIVTQYSNVCAPGSVQAFGF